MEGSRLHEQLQQASKQIHAAQESVRLAQGSDEELLEKAYEQLQEAEQVLETTQKEAGSEATKNPQFQQAYEQLHDTRQQVQEVRENHNDFL